MDEGYYHGINKMKKPGFKVIKPPGGQTQINIFAQDCEVKSTSPINACQAERNSSSIAFGNHDLPMKHCTKADRNCSSIVFGGPELQPCQLVDTTPKKNCIQNGDCGEKKSNGTVTETHNGDSQVKYTEQTSHNNEVQTPQTDGSVNNNAYAVRSSTKVMAPPGGRSSINLFG